MFFLDACFFFQVNISIGSHASEEVSEGDKVKVPTAMAALVEPYQGRPQLKGMRVRAKLAGAGSGETTKCTAGRIKVRNIEMATTSAR